MDMHELRPGNISFYCYGRKILDLPIPVPVPALVCKSGTFQDIHHTCLQDGNLMNVGVHLYLIGGYRKENLYS